MKKIFESLGPITLKEEDMGWARVIDIGEPEEIGGDPDVGMWIKVGSWDESGEHKDISALEGKKIRVTLEVISDEQE